MDAPEPTTGVPTRSEADVILVGAGPAGPTVAVSRARAGLDVLLLEKDPPRPGVHRAQDRRVSLS
jgi:flavin-dependent dehydrogenase